MRNRAERRYNRYVKGLRRLKKDRNQHGGDLDCPCFDDDASKGHGRVFAIFADYPKSCQHVGCKNYRHNGWGKSERRTLAERRFYEERIDI